MLISGASLCVHARLFASVLLGNTASTFVSPFVIIKGPEIAIVDNEMPVLRLQATVSLPTSKYTPYFGMNLPTNTVFVKYKSTIH